MNNAVPQLSALEPGLPGQALTKQVLTAYFIKYNK